MCISQWPKSAKILIIILFVLLVAESYFLYRLLRIVDTPALNFLETEKGSSWGEVIPKTIMGNIIDINSQAIKISATQIGETLLSSGKEQEKEITINADTKLRKYDPKSEGADSGAGIVEAKISDFKEGDLVSVQTDKNASESNLVAVDIQKISDPIPKSIESPADN